ncbi:MAG: allantoicase [Acidimicrobiia bacterium]|nr:allantoicase [Acidimicrobiia bacterium]
MTDLLSEAVGGRIVECNDEFFAPADNLIKVSDPVWKEGVYDDHGKWMDGWETRRRREPGYDWCILALGIPGRVETVDIDTAFFTGNYPEQFSLEGCGVGSDDRLGDAEWFELLAATDLEGDSKATFQVEESPRVTHLRLNIFPDGGVARLRVYGRALPAMQEVCPDQLIDLASLMVGGEFIDASNYHYNPPSKMLQPTEPAGMWDGWETARRRGPGHDWASFRLGLAGVVESVDADTSFFKGNSPGWVSVEVSDDGEDWSTVIDHQAVEPDSVNHLPMESPTACGFVRLSIHPDGGMARMRVWGRANPQAAGEKRIEYLNALDDQQAYSFFHTACASTAWVAAMKSQRPFAGVDSVMAEALEVFDRLTDEDWLEAFAGHPRIGERGDAVSSREQSGVTADSVEELSEVNRAYEEKFGFTYIVYATGRTGEEMLSIARERLGNSREMEIANGAAEQRKITSTRLRMMLCQEVE